MKKVTGLAALSAVLMVGSALPSFADTISGAGTTQSPAFLSNYGDTGTLTFPTAGVVKFAKGAFTYDYFFKIDAPAMLTGITASASSTFRNVPNVNFSSFQIVSLFGAVPVSGPTASYYPGLLGQSYTLAANTTYELIVKGNVTNGTGAFNGNLSVSAVPLPTSVALFGTALLGLGAFGAIRRKKIAASVA